MPKKSVWSHSQIWHVYLTYGSMFERKNSKYHLHKIVPVAEELYKVTIVDEIPGVI